MGRRSHVCFVSLPFNGHLASVTENGLVDALVVLWCLSLPCSVSNEQTLSVVCILSKCPFSMRVQQKLRESLNLLGLIIWAR